MAWYHAQTPLVASLDILLSDQGNLCMKGQSRYLAWALIAVLAVLQLWTSAKEHKDDRAALERESRRLAVVSGLNADANVALMRAKQTSSPSDVEAAQRATDRATGAGRVIEVE